jgi:hypothetical protein
MALLPNVSKATSPAIETVPISCFFDHLFCSNVKAHWEPDFLAIRCMPLVKPVF